MEITKKPTQMGRRVQERRLPLPIHRNDSNKNNIKKHPQKRGQEMGNIHSFAERNAGHT